MTVGGKVKHSGLGYVIAHDRILEWDVRFGQNLGLLESRGATRPSPVMEIWDVTDAWNWRGRECEREGRDERKRADKNVGLCVSPQAARCAAVCAAGVLFLGRVHLPAERGPTVCIRALFLACVSLCIILCIFNGWCAAVCARCRAHPRELLGVSGSRPSSPLCSPRSVLLASPSSLVLLCAQLVFVSHLFCNADKGISNRGPLQLTSPVRIL